MLPPMTFRFSLCVTLSGLMLSFSSEGATPGQRLQAWLTLSREARPELASQDFATEPLSKREAEIAHELAWKDFLGAELETRREELEAKRIEIGDHALRFERRTFGTKPETGHALFLSMHGGGNTRPEVNDRQWRNQIGLYEPEEGIYVAPRAPTDTWNLWHQAHIDPLFGRLIENFVMTGEVDPNRVYLMGYSAGGDGAYQVAPRMADRWAAAAMMAGHPNEARPDGLRNLGFALHMGAKDAAFKRNAVAREWKDTLAALREADPDGYAHQVQIHEGKGHWMDREDAVAVPWMAKFTRSPHPKKVVWWQDDVTHRRFYWLATSVDGTPQAGQKIVASLEGQTVTIEEVSGVSQFRILLADAMLNLDESVSVVYQGKTVFSGVVPRTFLSIWRQLEARKDPATQFCGELVLSLPAD
jgi:hypothetical protein